MYLWKIKQMYDFFLSTNVCTIDGKEQGTWFFFPSGNVLFMNFYIQKDNGS